MILNFSKGETIIHEGDPSQCAFILEGGRAEVLKQVKGQGQPVGTLGEGDLFGEMGLIDEQPRSATVRAVEDCQVTVLTKENYQELLENDPQALMKILKAYGERLRATLNKLEEVQTH